MRTILAALLVLMTALATTPAVEAVEVADPETRPACQNGLGWSFCNYNAVVCEGQVRFYHIEPKQAADIDCLRGAVECTVELNSFIPAVPQCDSPAVALPPLRSSDPVECWDGINGDGWCGVHVAGCSVGRAYESDPKYDQWLEAGCSGFTNCRIDFDNVGSRFLVCTL